MQDLTPQSNSDLVVLCWELSSQFPSADHLYSVKDSMSFGSSFMVLKDAFEYGSNGDWHVEKREVPQEVFTVQVCPINTDTKEKLWVYII